MLKASLSFCKSCTSTLGLVGISAIIYGTASSLAILANTVGSTGGFETHTLITAEIPAHTHSYNFPAVINQGTASGSAINAGSGSNTNSGSTGGGDPHNNMQPSLVMMMIMRTI